MIKLSDVPDGYTGIIKRYGNPDADGDSILDPEWYQEATTNFPLPWPMRLSWDPAVKVHNIRAHRIVGPAIIDALFEIEEKTGYLSLEVSGHDYLGGAYNFRHQRNSKWLSTHAWGIAIDINPHLGGLGNVPEMPEIIVEAFKKRGFEWGGDWPALNPKWPYDGMHFQAATGY